MLELLSVICCDLDKVDGGYYNYVDTFAALTNWKWKIIFLCAKRRTIMFEVKPMAKIVKYSMHNLIKACQIDLDAFFLKCFLIIIIKAT